MSAALAFVAGFVGGVVLLRVCLQEWGQTIFKPYTRRGRFNTYVGIVNPSLRPRNDAQPVYCWRINPRARLSRWWFRHTVASATSGEVGL